MRGLLFLTLLVFGCLSWGHDRLLGQTPRAYEKYAGFNPGNNGCRNVVEPTRQRLLQLRRAGHKVVMIMTSGSPIKMSQWRIRDDFNGVVYSDIHSYLQALEEFASRNTSWRTRRDYQEIVKRCVRGSRGAQLNGESCVYRSDVRYFHMGFAILDPHFSDQPYVVHFYGDPNYNFLKASIYVETLDSYLREDRLTHCDATLMTLGRRMEDRVFDFLRGDHAQQVLASGNRSYNLVAHPWGLRTQNCNIWVSEVMASAYFVNRGSWPQTDRRLAKDILSKTRFRPVKVPLTGAQSLGRLAAPFVGGIDGEEGNFQHYYGVADIVPARSIIEWLQHHQQIKQIEIIRGR